MQSESKSGKWPLVLGSKLLQVYPFGTVVAIVLALLAQIAQIGAFLMPMKIIMLMASEGMPHYMPSSVASMDKKDLILALAILSIISYLFYLAATKAIDKLALVSCNHIEKSSKKLYLFEGQEELTQNSYKRYIDAVASISFVALGTACLFALNDEVAITLIIYVSTCIAGIIVTLRVKEDDKDSIIGVAQKKSQTLSGIGFFLIFAWVLVDYIFFTIPGNFVILLVSIILSRQILTRIPTIANSLIYLTKNKEKLRAILFHEEAFQLKTNKNVHLCNFLEPQDQLHKLLKQALTSIAEPFSTGATLTWHDSGIPGIGFIKAEPPHSEVVILVKIFEQKKTTEARHEASLLLEETERLPSPKLALNTKISYFYIHALDITGYEYPLPNVGINDQYELMNSISEVSIPNELKTRYLRSHRMLWDHLELSSIKKLRLVSKEMTNFDNLVKEIPKVKKKLKDLPLELYNPQLGNLNLYTRNPDGKLEALHWGQWSIEPTGINQNKKSQKSSLSQMASIKPNSLSNDQNSAFLAHQLRGQLQKELLSEATWTFEALVRSCR